VFLAKQVGAAERMIQLQSERIRSFNASLHEQVAREIESRPNKALFQGVVEQCPPPAIEFLDRFGHLPHY
jgi:hypothetical protein